MVGSYDGIHIIDYDIITMFINVVCTFQHFITYD